MLKEQFFATLQNYLPSAAIDYCYHLWQQHAFLLKISKARASKLGDYRYHPRDKKHTITVNHNLNQYNFLLTYIHEVAHLVAFKNHSRNIAPHGREWKQTFQQLMLPVLHKDVFPPQLLAVLRNHMQNPKASSCSDNHLTLIMRQYNPPSDARLLADLHFGQQFIFKERMFEKKSLKRTRVVCREIKSNRNYLISKFAEVRTLSEEKNIKTI